MPIINRQPDLIEMFNNIELRMRRLESAKNFNVPYLQADPQYPNNGDMWVRGDLGKMYIWQNGAKTEVPFGFGLTYADLNIPGMTTSFATYQVTIPLGKQYTDIVSVVPLQGLNDTVSIHAIETGPWVYVQTATQITITAKLGNAVASTTGAVRFWFYQ